jgi:uncharacterized phage protein (TIGR01671 family)
MKNREIKFRAWHPVRKEMLQVISLHNLHSQVNVHSDLAIDDESQKVLSTHHSLSAVQSDIAYCQFTGLKDKNGKEIYEGDILDLSEPLQFTGNKPKQKMPTKRGKIIFHEGSFLIKQKSKKVRLSSLTIRYCGLEVIGNIYENPELLK